MILSEKIIFKDQYYENRGSILLIIKLTYYILSLNQSLGKI